LARLETEGKKSLMSLSFNLYRLQQVDTRLSHTRARVKAIQDALDNDEEIRSARAQARAAEEAGLRAESAMRGAEYETQAVRIKIQQAESSLYGGRVINPKELQDLQKDIESLKRQMVVLEDRELEAMIYAEKATEIQAEAQIVLRDAAAAAEIKMRDLLVEQQRFKAEIEGLEREREAIASGIDKPTLLEYDGLLSQKRGLAVATLSDDACGGCGAPLTPATRQAVHIAGQLVHCPSCGRLLYAD
jgi:uncharacterized protein